MKTALDCYTRGKQKESSADDYILGSFYSRERFICPECGEFVHLKRSKYSNYFAHYKKSETSAECDRRVDGVQTDSIYERMGLPIYIRHGALKDYYELYLGFKSLPASIMDQAITNKIRLSIDGKITYSINRERFSDEETVLISIKHIPRLERRYSIVYSPADKARSIIKHWSDFADGFSNSGSLFTISDHGGRKIRHGDIISTDVEYYWVKRDNYIPLSLPGLHMREHGKLLLENSYWYVFKGFFSSNISDKEFERLTSYLRDYLKVYLLEKEPKYVPLWPPLIKQEDSYLVEPGKRKIYGCIISGNDEPKMYIYKGVMATPAEIVSRDKLLAVKVESSDCLVNIDRKYISGGTRFKVSAYEMASDELPMNIVCDDYTLDVENQILEINDIPNVINNIDNKLLVVVKKTGEIRTFDNRKALFDIHELEFGDTIYVLTSTCLRGIIKITKKDIKSSLIDESIIEKKLYLLKASNHAVLPSKLRAKLISVEWKNKEIERYIKKCLGDNKVPMPLISLLEEVVDGKV